MKLALAGLVVVLGGLTLALVLGGEELGPGGTSVTAAQPGVADPSEASSVALVRPQALPTRPAGAEASEERSEQTEQSAAPERRSVEGVGQFRLRVREQGGRPLPDVAVHEFMGLSIDGVLELARAADVRWGEPPGVRTDAEGLAEFDGLAERYERAGSPIAGGGHWTWLLATEAVTTEPAFVALDRERLGRGEAELVLPPCGQVRVRICGPDGVPLAEAQELGAEATEYEVRLERVDPAELDDPDLAFARTPWRRTTRSGEALYPLVERGETYRAYAQRGDSGIVSQSAPAGLVYSTGELVLDVLVGADHPLLSYRAVDEGGRPLPHCALVLERFEHFGSEQKLSTRTDEHGRFLLEVRRIQFLGGTLQVTTVEPQTADGADEPEVWTGRVVYSGGGETGLREAGDIVLRPPGALASGRVVRTDGRPVEGAKVRCGVTPVWDDEGWFRQGPDPVETSSDAAGRFELTGRRESQTFQVWAESRGMRSEPVEVQLGERGVELVLVERCVVRGTLLVEAAEDPGGQRRAAAIGALTIRLEQEGKRVAGTAQTDSLGGFATEPVPPGTYDLVCALQDEVLVTVPGIEVLGDVHVGEIDLRGRLHATIVELRGPGGLALELGSEQLSGGSCRWRPSGTPPAEWANGRLDGVELCFWSSQPRIDVQVDVKGFRRAEGTGLRGTARLELHPALRVRVIVETDGPIPEPPYVFDPELQLDGQTVSRADGPRFLSATRRELVFDVLAPGTLTVRWHLERREENLAVGSHVLSDHEREIEVLDMPGEQVFRVQLDGAALERLATSPPF